MGCGAVRPKRELRRIALVDGEPVLDREARLPGRGAYVCGKDCARRAVEKQGFSRAFKRRVQPGPMFVESLETDGEEARARDREGAGDVLEGRPREAPGRRP
ncbi:YlxR family protein [Conexibacter sp. SYSU D00693]|uniref:YlxR family protein n=1 Tax=Conexibacter sp. SYSU D00693 TaxID=2812560 RepID=UPI00196AE196